MRDYYGNLLAGERLLRCYELAPPRIRRYLDAELRFVVDRVRGSRRVLELGCGYGRVMKRLSRIADTVVGCDTSQESLLYAKSFLAPRRNCVLIRANAAQTAFRPGSFDATLCVQNGISAFAVDRPQLVTEAARITKDGGQILFSSYSPRIWEERLLWFREQAREGLVGPIDESRTGDGTIVCTDGFRATTVDGAEFVRLFEGIGLRATLREVDGSSLFCFAVKGAGQLAGTAGGGSIRPALPHL